jgi:beta-lactam-binding protein with PASTA domain
MAEPPRTPPDPPDPPEDETLVVEEWPARPEGEVVVEQTETATAPRRPPQIWPWLLALLLLVLGGLGALYYFTQDDDDDAAATTATATTAPTTTAREDVQVPDVVGTTSSEATATLRDAGFTVNVEPVPSDQPAGTVVAQAPAAGSEQPEGSSVRLNVAREASDTTGATTAPPPATTAPPDATTAPPPATAPPEPATVPDVVGDELADAAREFADEGLKVAVQYVPSTEAQGRVVAQAQPAGTERRRGDTVQVNVSIGAEPAAPASVPGVVRQRQDRARGTLESAGFEVLALSLDGEVRNESIVASQSPGARASIPRGSLVLLYVGA